MIDFAGNQRQFCTAISRCISYLIGSVCVGTRDVAFEHPLRIMQVVRRTHARIARTNCIYLYSWCSSAFEET